MILLAALLLATAPAPLETLSFAAEPPAVTHVQPGRPPTPHPTPPQEPAPLPRATSPEPEPTPGVASPASEPPAATAHPESASQAEPAPAPTAPADTLELARRLFPADDATPRAAGTSGQPSVDELYAQLFPGGPPRTVAETVEPDVELADPALGVPFGPFRIRAGLDARYVDADIYLDDPDSRTRDRYLAVAPRIDAEAPLGEGRLGLEYLPTFRAFGTYDEVNAATHRVGGRIELPLGRSVTLGLQDAFVSGVLDTRDADPGGEYFFDLGRFRRNTLDGGATIVVGPRLSLELQGATSSLVFEQQSSFFSHDSRLASVGLAYELTPTLETTLSYAYDTVPRPADRPQAQAQAHNAQVTLAGDILPLVTAQLSLGYRNQHSPNAGEGGTRYSGFVMSGSVSKQFSRDSDMTLFLNRSTPVSAFEDNAFYVFTGVQVSGRLALPLGLQLQAGVGYQWNDYRTEAPEIGGPREDRILAYSVGLRRAIRRQLALSATYRREERRSNLARFDTRSDGFVVQLEWDILGSRR